MAKLIVNPSSSSKREISVPRSLLSIGRDPSNDLVLPDAMVSRRHAVIEFRGSQYYIRDCNSSNGSLVNGDRISERSLRDGDLLAIGTSRLLFKEELEASDPGSKVIQHPSAPRLQCPTCKADYRKGDLFCKRCGTQVAPNAQPKVVCTSCGTVVPLPAQFCNACGGRLVPQDHAFEPTRPRTVPEDVAVGGEDAGPLAKAVESRNASAEPARVLESSPAEANRGVADPATDSPLHSEPTPASSPAGPAASRLQADAASASPAARLHPESPRPAPSAMPRPAMAAGRPAPARPPLAEAGPRVERRPEPRTQPPSIETAGFGPRLGAGLLDGLLVGTVQAVLLAPVFAYWWSRELPQSPSQVPFLPILLSLAILPLAAILGALYFVYFWGVRGATPGKRLFGLAVEAEDGSHPIGIPRAAVRFLGCLVSGALLGLGFLMILIDGSGLHDRIAGTRVVRREGD